MKRSVIASIVLVLLSAAGVLAQAPPSCPKVEFNRRAGETITGQSDFIATVKGGDPAVKPSFKWSASAGTVHLGTTSHALMFLDVKQIVAGTTIFLGVEVTGYGCRVANLTLVKVGKQAGAPTTAPVLCPKVRTMGPSSEVKPGEALTFTADVSGGDPKVDPTYSWSVSAGTISSGQGTSVIQVDTTGLGGQTVTATVEAGGFAGDCGISSSWTANVKAAVKAQKIDTYFALKPKDEQPRLDNALIQTQMDPTSTLYIVAYPGIKSKTAEVDGALNRAKDYVTRTRGLDNSRSRIMIGGAQDVLTIELWLVPEGGSPPEPTPATELKKKP